jgi:2,4-dienoyl-CoA reductase-like NADH-dependent reductase (Old Yellow Enzyme family)
LIALLTVSADSYLFSLLPAQFLHSNTNAREDAYGGSVENRTRLALEVIDAVVDAFGSADRVAIRFSPYGRFLDTRDRDPVSTWGYLCRAIAARTDKLAYVHFVEPRMEAEEVEFKERTLEPFRAALMAGQTPMLSAGGYTAQNAWGPVANGTVDGVVFGRWFISNPDLVERIRTGGLLNDYDRSTFYGKLGGLEKPEAGYTDYPFLK